MGLTAYLGIASGVALALTALGLAVARPRRVGSWMFVAFLLAWGAETALFNSLTFLSDPDTIQAAVQIGFAIVLIETLFLVHFTVRFTRSYDTPHRWWSWGVFAFVLVVGGLLALDPGRFAGAADASIVSTSLVTIPRFAAIFLVVGILAGRHRDARTEIEHRETRIVLLGLSLYAGYTAGFYLSLYNLAWLRTAVSPSQKLLGGLFIAGTLFLAAVALTIWRTRPHPEHWRGWERRVVVAALAIPLGLGLLTGTAETVNLPRIDLFGVVRIGTALVVAYGLVKFEIFEIDRRVKRTLRGSVIASAFVVAFFLVSETVEILVSDAAGIWAGLGAAGLLTLAFRPIEHRATQLANRTMPGVGEGESYLQQRRTEVYQAAVERALGDEVLTEREKEILVGLREDLGLDDEEARRIEEAVLATPIGA